MEELHPFLQWFAKGGATAGVLSQPTKKDSPYLRCKITLLSHKGELRYQLEQFTQKQAFHQNLSLEEIVPTLEAIFPTEYQQFAFTAEGKRYSLRVTKKGKLLTHQTKAEATPSAPSAHNREKNYLLPSGIPVAPLVDLGILTHEGKVVQSMYHKYKQINRFLEMVQDSLEGLGDHPLQIVDFGCGKSYLTFVVYHYLTQVAGRDVTMIGMDLKADVIGKCNALAEKYGYTGLAFQTGDIADYLPDKPVDMVIALHACDTATDYALYHGVRMGSKVILSAPCCQHQLHGQAKSEQGDIMLRYGILQERFSALATDAIRGNLLEMMGYKTQLLEFVDLEHSPKNILIRAIRKGKQDLTRQPYLAEIQKLCQQYGFRPKLAELFGVAVE